MAKLGPMTARRGMFEITPETFNGIEEAIRWAEGVQNRLARNYHMGQLVRFMAYTNLGIAQRMSAGPYDPQQRNPGAAWRVPVRRITESYMVGWKVRKRGPATWELYNDSRAAYFVEFGIHNSGNRVRRPIRKLSLMKTMMALRRTHAAHRVWCDIYADPRHPRGQGFTQIVQSPGSHLRWENVTEHVARGVVRRRKPGGARPKFRRVGGQLQMRTQGKNNEAYRGPMLGRRLP